MERVLDCVWIAMPGKKRDLIVIQISLEQLAGRAEKAEV
tara:strand:- start:2537 stop:2653 length:117 start_codon:yes stop_codon:yes gene_type:complete